MPHNLSTWLAVLTTVAMLLIYETAQFLMSRRNPAAVSRTAHARLRELWFLSVSRQPGSEILAVQALRNSLMSAAMLASTAVLGLMGTVTLAAPSLNATFGAAVTGIPQLTPRMTLELVLMVLLFASLVASAMAIRYYNHVSFISSIPVGSPEREQWQHTGTIYVRRAGVMYSWALRHLILVAPVLASLLHPFAGPPASAAVVALLYAFDRFERK
ncbi:MAG: DUF599 domain-containing protein [Burkholderiales bacterium]|nr:DUF599 domain-containing protein [Burkholderiales bacterium]